MSGLLCCRLQHTMLAASRMELMTPTADAPDDRCIASTAIDFHIPLVFPLLVQPGQPSKLTPLISKQLSDTNVMQGKGSSDTYIHLRQGHNLWYLGTRGLNKMP